MTEWLLAIEQGKTMSEVNRNNLYQETHARPYLSLPVPCAVGHILYWRGDRQSSELLDLAKSLANRQGENPSNKHNSFFEYTCQNYHIRFEQHTEFDTLTIAQSISAEAELFGDNPLAIIDDAQLQALEPNLLVKTRIHLLLKPADESNAEEATTERPNSLIGAQFSDIHGSAAIYGSWIMGRRAEAYSDFKLDAQGYSRFLVVSHALNPADAGRVVTRLLEMENYRITALIPLDIARAVSKTLSQADAQLVRILDEIADSDSAETQHDLLTIYSPSRNRSRATAINCPRAFPPAKPTTSWSNSPTKNSMRKNSAACNACKPLSSAAWGRRFAPFPPCARGWRIFPSALTALPNYCVPRSMCTCNCKTAKCSPV